VEHVAKPGDFVWQAALWLMASMGAAGIGGIIVGEIVGISSSYMGLNPATVGPQFQILGAGAGLLGASIVLVFPARHEIPAAFVFRSFQTTFLRLLQARISFSCLSSR
jgi:hypothetical protein